jgi:hypothetical protein
MMSRMGTILSVTSQTRHRLALIEPPGELMGVALEYRPNTWHAYEGVGDLGIQVSPLQGAEWTVRANAAPRTVRLEEMPGFVDSVAELATATVAQLIDFMKANGTLATPDGGELMADDLREEADRIRQIRDRLDAALRHENAASDNDWMPAHWLENALRRYCTLGARQDDPHLMQVALMADSPFGFAYLCLVAFARQLRAEDDRGNPARLPGRWSHCANDKCSRTFWKTRRLLYCKTCRDSGADAAHRRRRERAAAASSLATRARSTRP